MEQHFKELLEIDQRIKELKLQRTRKQNDRTKYGSVEVYRWL